MESIVRELSSNANRIRQDIVKMIGHGKAGHLGGSCSIADIVTVLYKYVMKHDPKNPKWEDRDRFILSKGHAAIIQYALLADCGYFPKKELDNLKKLGAMLQGHPDLLKIPGVEANTGSLGQGLSIACGMAAGAKLDKKAYRVYCILGDGELAEGQIWEAAMSAAYYKLDNLTAILDKNRIQATGAIEERFDTNPHSDKWKAFGWHVTEIDGHDINQIIEALNQAKAVKGKPVIIIAHTVKGKGISFAENNAAFHNGIMTREQYEQALCELGSQGAGTI